MPKNYLSEIAGAGFLPGQLTNLRQNIRTQQAGSGLLYGGAAAKQEARTIGQLSLQNQLRSAAQLAELTQMEAMLPQEIEALVANTEASLMGAAIPQLQTPIRALGDLYGGAQQGLGSIFSTMRGAI